MPENDIAEVYDLTSMEQMRALADARRVHILDRLAHQAMTVTQLGAELGIAAPKVHYHVRELERVGLLRLVETREKGGILEKYYRAVARTINVPQTLLRSAPPDESSAAVGVFVQHVAQDLIDALSRSLHDPEANTGKAMFDGEIVWMTNDELTDVAAQVRKIFEPYRSPGDVPGRRERVFAQLSYPAPTPANIPSAPPSAASTEEPCGEPTIRRIVFAGVFQYTRQDLEHVIARHEKLDLRMAGVITMAPDVTPDLIDRAIARFRYLGVVHAAREVREALKRKEV